MMKNESKRQSAVTKSTNTKSATDVLCYSVKELAAVLKCSERLIQKLIYEGKLQAFKNGRRLMVLDRDLHVYINKNMIKAVSVDQSADQIFRPKRQNISA